GMVAPAAGPQMTALLALALALAGALLASGRAEGRRAHGGAVLGLVAVSAAAVPAAGVRLGLLEPAGWGDLVDGLRSGLASLPDLGVPYGGAAEWARLAIVLGGGGLLIAAAACAFWPGRRDGRVPAAVLLCVLYGVPAAQLAGSHRILQGALFTALVAALLWLEEVRRGDARLAATVVAAAIGLGAVAAPWLHPSRPWADYESFAQRIGSRSGVAFDFDHRYGRLTWPRDGRELFRIRAARREYWKAVDLDQFDGTRWVRAPRRFGASLADELPGAYARRRAWNQRIRVTVQALRSSDLVAAGTTLFVDRPPSAAVATPAPGTFRLERPLARGDSYAATVYDPRPTHSQLAAAGTGYPGLASRYLELTVPVGPGPRAPMRRVVLPAWGRPRAASAAATLRASPYGPAWALSRRLARGSRSPYDYVQRVLAHLSAGYGYSEATPRRAVPLEAFLFRDRTGYCQQFSGAMALLLRMGGVPARVAAGFAPGTYSRPRGEWIVRDLDAHSWVEAYFPRYGWVTFDPTPGAAPARSQIDSPPGTDAGANAAAARGDRPQPGPRALPPAPGPGATGWLPWLAGALAAIAGAAAWWSLAGRHPRRGGSAVDELERALRLAREPATPATTLRALERRFAGDPGVAYLSALRAMRFGYGDSPPSPAQRRSLRRALARGRGMGGRLRALWALPPHPLSVCARRPADRPRREATPGP
ncbi:MAG TPA: transglutaminaseTgpA domain-containing protein, partial [Solirubrobacteraceae bacterium]|nr:transglutaminaseTgpA domain-containing protein [Solirubrobacteraceae bacterium]